MISIHGFEYFDELPKTTRLATMDDFHKDGRLKVGMYFIVHQYSDGKYGLYEVHKTLTGKRLKPFIDHGRIFIFVPERYNVFQNEL